MIPVSSVMAISRSDSAIWALVRCGIASRGYNGGFSLGKQSEMEDGIPDYLPSSAVAYRSIHRSRSYRTASLIIGD